ncbi:MAG: glycerate kinase [Methylacidiphilales bacterium]|nr:glycerate kinase [Candidatus Methylacidiphilales bacterium]
MPRNRRAREVSYKIPRRILIAPDKFKGTLTSEAAARAIEKGLRRAWPGVKTTLFTLTDGGEGFVEVMVRQSRGRFRAIRTIDAALRPCRAKWGLLDDGHTAVIGLAEASGIAQLPPALRNPEQTNNLGTGRLITLALREGCTEILVGLGGSATTEGGISLAAAIGYRFLDQNGRDIPLNGAGLAQLARIVPPAELPRARFVVATDVDNPLYGPKGAAVQFGPQKGADSAMVARLDAGLRRLARIVRRDLGRDAAQEPGAGAAGGCGYGLIVFFNARRENGFQLVRRLAKLDALVRAHDLVITGEGSFDRTSLLGKAPAQLGRLARKLNRPAWAFCGRVALPLAKTPFDKVAALSTREKPGPPPESLTSALHARRLEKLAYDLASSSNSRAGSERHRKNQR